jgi:phosphoglycolate phosphatase-like HAD superfamily hydrolase
MKSRELKDAITLKTLEFETAVATGKPNKEVMRLYKQLKELKYQLVIEENVSSEKKDLDLA